MLLLEILSLGLRVNPHGEESLALWSAVVETICVLREIALHHFLFTVWLNQFLIESSSALGSYVDSTTLWREADFLETAEFIKALWLTGILTTILICLQ